MPGPLPAAPVPGAPVPVDPVPAPLDDATFTQLLQQAMPGLTMFVRRLCGTATDADDVLQETLAKVWRLRASYDPSRGGDAWLLQAAFRCFCDHRKRQRAVPAPCGDLVHGVARRDACALELRDELRHRLAALDPFARTLLLAFHQDGRSLQDLAQLHRMPVNTVKSHLHRARQRLAEGRP
jgi:RNA polymerase sigma-70 factor, ECF subfamily